MVEVKGEVELNMITKKARVSLFADTKSEVSTDMDIVGMPQGYDIAFGSKVLTADGDLAFYKSTGEWNWVE